MGPKDLPTGARLFCYKYALSVRSFLCRGEERRVVGGAGWGHVWSQGKGHSLHRKTRHQCPAAPAQLVMLILVQTKHGGCASIGNGAAPPGVGADIRMQAMEIACPVGGVMSKRRKKYCCSGYRVLPDDWASPVTGHHATPHFPLPQVLSGFQYGIKVLLWEVSYLRLTPWSAFHLCRT